MLYGIHLECEGDALLLHERALLEDAPLGH
jgi:hypothetical protein